MLRNSTPYRARKAEKKDPRRLGLLLGAICLGAVVLLVAAIGIYREMSRSYFFRLADVEVRGEQRISEKEIIEAGGIQLHSNLLALSVDAIRQKIEQLPWIERVEIRRNWPNGLVVTVWEREPVAVANVSGTLYYMDNRGYIFTTIAPGQDHDFPVISGLGEESLQQEPSSAVNCALQFLRYVRKNDPVLPRQNISEIAIQPAGDLIAYLADRPFPIYLGSDNMETRYYRLVKVLYRLYKKKEFEVTEYIKLDYLPQKVLVGKTG